MKTFLLYFFIPLSLACIENMQYYYTVVRLGLRFTLVKPKKKRKEKKNVHHHFTTVTINSRPVTKNTAVVQLVPERGGQFMTKRNNMV